MVGNPTSYFLARVLSMVGVHPNIHGAASQLTGLFRRAFPSDMPMVCNLPKG